MDCMRLIDSKQSQSTNATKRNISLFLIVAVCVAYGSWTFFREQRINVLRDTEVLLWTETRATVSNINNWYAAIKHQGVLSANSALVKLFIAEHSSTLDVSGAARPDISVSTQKRLATQTDAMVLYLQRMQMRTDALLASLVNINGEELVQSLHPSENSDIKPGAISETLNKKAVIAALSEAEATPLDVRQGPDGLLFDVVFPVYGSVTEPDKPPLIGGIILTISLKGRLTKWLSSGNDSVSTNLLLKKRDAIVESISEDGLVPHEWRNGQIIPGSTRGVVSGYAEEVIKYETQKTTPGFWRLARYTVPAQEASPERLVLGVGVRVPLIPEWYVVKEIPATQTVEHINSLRTQAILGGIALAALLQLLLTLHWWWFDGRVENKLCTLVKSERNQLVPLINSTLPDGISLTGVDGRFQYVNQSFAKIFDKTPQDFTGKTLLDIFDARKAREHHVIDINILADLKPLAFTDTLYSEKSTEFLQYEIYKAPLITSDQETIGVVSVFHRIND